MASGMVYIFTGDGKGKTSAALGCAVRAVGHGKRVVMVQWYKERRWKIGEHALPAKLVNLEIYPMGKGFYLNRHYPQCGRIDYNVDGDTRKAVKMAPIKGGGVVVDGASAATHKQAAQAALDKAGELLSLRSSLFLLILDEALNAVSDGLISQIGLIRLIRQRKITHIILTGRRCPKELIALADLVTEMKNIKHPYDSGRKAVLGLDF